MAVRTVEAPTKLFSDEWVGHQVDVPSGASVFALVRRATKPSSKPPLILLHGYPQTHSMWSTMVKRGLPSSFDERSVIIPDLPGYGLSTKKPSEDGSHRAHSKRAIAQDILDAVDALLGTKDTEVVLLSHDRGARVSYRAALDHPKRVRALSVADIVPTTEQFKAMSYENGRHAESLVYFHWIFLAAAAPIPETLLAAAPREYFSSRFGAWGASGWRPDPEELESWVAPYEAQDGGYDRIVGSCEDYRAGATIDLEHEAQDLAAGRKIQCPTQVLYSSSLGGRHAVKDIWRRYVAEGVPTEFHQVGDTHFILNAEPAESARLYDDWLRRQIDV